MLKKYIEAGEVVSTHGIAGEIKVYPWCDGAGFFANIAYCFLQPDGKKRCNILQARSHKDMALLKLEGFDLVETARTLIGSIVYIDREQINLPKDRYFIQDIIGLQAKDDKTGFIYGTITNIARPAATDIYTIKTEKGDVLFPAVAEFLGEINLEKGYITIKPIEGMFNECESI